MKAARPPAISSTGRTASNADRRRAVSDARRALARAVLVERRIRPVEVS